MHTPADQMKPLSQLLGLGGTYSAATGLMGLIRRPAASRPTDGKGICTLSSSFEPPNWESSKLSAPEPAAHVVTQLQQVYPLRREAALLGGLSLYGMGRQQCSKALCAGCILSMDALAAIDINSRVILVFISSTFRDFTNEPDILVEQVFASLLSKAQEWSLIRW